MIPSFAILHFEMPRISAERLINLSHHIFFLKTWLTLLGYILYLINSVEIILLKQIICCILHTHSFDTKHFIG